MEKTGIVEGSDLLLYVNKGTGEVPAFIPIAHSTSHTVTTSGEAKKRKTKDTAGAFDHQKVTSLSQQIKCEALKSYDGYGYFELKDLMLKRESVLLKFAPKEDTVTGKYEEGMYCITSLEQTAAAGEDATFSVTFDNDGEFKVTSKTV